MKYFFFEFREFWGFPDVAQLEVFLLSMSKDLGSVPRAM